MFKKIRGIILRVVRQRQLNTLHKHIYSGAVFLRILNDELVKLPRHKRKRFIRALYSDCKIAEEIIQHCEIKAEYMIKTMKGQLKVFKKKKTDQRKTQRKAGKKDVKAMVKGAEEVSPIKKPTAIKPEQILVDGKTYNPKKPGGLPEVSKIKPPQMKTPKPDAPVDGAKYYKDLKDKEAKGELPEQIKDEK